MEEVRGEQGVEEVGEEVRGEQGVGGEWWVEEVVKRR